MLPPFIIEQIRRREEQEQAQRDAERPRLELPLDVNYRRPAEDAPREADDEPERGVVILDIV